MLTNLLKIIICFIVIILQISFINGQNNQINLINLFVIFSALFLILDWKYSFFYIILLGMLGENFSNYSYGIILFSLLLTFVIELIIYKHVFTNRSFYSSLMIFNSAYLIFYLIFLFLIKITFIIFPINHFNYLLKDNFGDVFFQGILYNNILFIILLLFINFTTTKFNHAFLNKD